MANDDAAQPTKSLADSESDAADESHLRRLGNRDSVVIMMSLQPWPN